MNGSKDYIPLVVDLDGSLIQTELPWESFLSVLVQNPFQLLKIFVGKIRNKVSLKMELEKKAQINLEKIPWSNAFLQYLREEKSKGRLLILCTGSTQSYAEKIQKIIQLFDFVWGSSHYNLVGEKKARFLVSKYGEKGFDYAGNSIADLKIISHARDFIWVNPSFLALFFSKKLNPKKIFKDKKLDTLAFRQCLGYSLHGMNILAWLTSYLFFYVCNHVAVFSYIGLQIEFASFWKSVMHLLNCNLLATAFSIFFYMIRIPLDRDQPIAHDKNLFATGDFSIMIGFLLLLFSLSFSVFCSIYLSLFNLFYLLPLILYNGFLYWLIYKTRRGNLPSFCMYFLMLCFFVVTMIQLA